MSDYIDPDLASLAETLSVLPGVFVPLEGPWKPTADENGRWRFSLFLDIVHGGYGSLDLILGALQKTKIRCGVVADPRHDWLRHILDSKGGTSPGEAASLVAAAWEDWSQL